MTKNKSTNTPFTPYERLVITLLALTQFTVVLDFMVMSPMGDLLMKSMNISTTQFGFAVAAYALSAGLSGLLTAGFADRFDRKKLLIFFYTGFILGTLLCGISNSFLMLLIARIITGIFGGVIGSISMAIVADIFPFQQRGRVMGFMQMGFGASQVLGIPISLAISNIWGWQAPFLMIVGLATIIAIMLLTKLSPIVKHLEGRVDKNAFHHLWATIANRDYRIGFLSTAMLSLGGFMIMPWGSAFAINNLGVTPQLLPILFMIAGVATLLIMPIVGKLSDKYDKFKIFTFASIWMVFIVIIYTNLTPIPFWQIVLLNVMMMMGVMSRMIPSMALTTSLPNLHDRGAFMSINSSLQQIAGGIAAGIGGLIVFQETKTSPLKHYDILGFVVAVIVVICIYLVYRVSQLVKKRQQQENSQTNAKSKTIVIE